jgi:hypothetical protein
VKLYLITIGLKGRGLGLREALAEAVKSLAEVGTGLPALRPQEGGSGLPAGGAIHYQQGEEGQGVARSQGVRVKA